MKKIFNVVAIIFVLSLFIVPKLSHASVVLTASSIASTSATLKATGLQNNTGIVFTLRNNINYPSTPIYFKTNTETSGGTGQATSLFSGLKPNGQYVASINYVGQNSVIGTYNFFTINLTTSGLLATTVTLNGTGFIPNKEVGFKLISTDAIGLYNTTITKTSSSTGTASATFSNPPLTESTPYKGTIFYTDNPSLILAEVIFTTGSLNSYTVIMTPLSLTTSSLTLRAENLLPNRSVILSVVSKNSATPAYSEQYQTTTSNIGKASADFVGLSSNSEYVGSAYYEGTTTVVGSTTFRTLADMVTEVRNIDDTSATVIVKNFPPNKEISINVYNFDLETPAYTNPQDVMTDNAGAASTQFLGLSPGGHYKYTHSEGTGIGSFWTTGNAPTGGNGSGGGGGNGDGESLGGDSSDPGGLVPCGTTRNPTPCGFKDIMTLINTVINFLLFVMAIPIAAIMFAYAGFMLVFSGGASEKRSKAKSIFINVAIGLVLAAAAWLIVHTILTIVGFDGSWIGL